MTSNTATATAPAWASRWTALALAELPADITTATPPQVDEVIRTVQLDTLHLGTAYDRALTVIRKAIGHEPTVERVGHGRDRHTVTTWPTSKTEAIAEARALPADTRGAYYSGADTVGEAVAALDLVCAQMIEAHEIESAGHAEFARRGGWTRFWMVDNKGGHVHTDRTCRTTYVMTQWNWPTNLSGADGAQVVEYAGALTCLVCFPDEREDILAGRPVRFDMFETREQRDERERRETELNARNAAKIAKGVTPTGKPLVLELGRTNLIGFGSYLEVKTERAAELRYVELAALAQTRRHWVTDDDKAVAARVATELAEALAWKRGVTVDAIVAQLAPKVTRKINAN